MPLARWGWARLHSQPPIFTGQHSPDPYLDIFDNSDSLPGRVRAMGVHQSCNDLVALIGRAALVLSIADKELAV